MPLRCHCCAIGLLRHETVDPDCWSCSDRRFDPPAALRAKPNNAVYTQNNSLFMQTVLTPTNTHLY